MKNIKLISLTILLAFFTSCNQTKLSDEDAIKLVKMHLHLPAEFQHNVNRRPTMVSGFELDGLRDAGLITGAEYLDSRTPIQIEITEKGKSSYIGLGEVNMNTDNRFVAYQFKTHDIDLGGITGIAINKEDQTAIIRFTLKAKNVTPAGIVFSKTKAGFSGRYFINYSLDNYIDGELTFKKFDKGWQLQTDQNKSAEELLDQILNGKK